MPRAELCRQLAPRNAGMNLVEHCIHDGSRISARSPAARFGLCFDDVLDPVPLLITQRLILKRTVGVEPACVDALVGLAVGTFSFDYASDDLALGAPDS